MSDIKATTRVMQYDGELYLSVGTLEELLRSMRRDDDVYWQDKINTIQSIVDNARAAERRLR